MKQLDNSFARIWTWPVLVAVVGFSALIAFVAQPHIPLDATGKVFIVFPVMAFGILIWLKKLLECAEELAGSEFLTGPEQRRFARTRAKKMRIYLAVGSVAIALGSAEIILYFVVAESWVFSVAVLFTTLFSLLSYVICWFEEIYNSSVKQYLRDRDRKQRRKKHLLDNMGNGPSLA